MGNETPTAASLVDGLQEDQRRRWRAGERALAETYFEQHPELLGAEPLALQLLYGEIILREESGETPQPEEYQRRFPHLATQLPLLFEVHRALESGALAGSLAGSSTGSLPWQASQSALTIAEELHTRFDAEPTRNGTAALSFAVPGYEILEELGRGAMGVVYKARQAGLGRIVALKMIVLGRQTDAALQARFRAEAEALAKLEHPNIVKIHEVGAHDGCPYFSFEFVAGGTLAQHLKGMPQPARLAAAFVAKLARAVHAAHQQGIIHRDLKPANILLKVDQPGSPPRTLDDTIVPKITDFGLAKDLHLDAGQTGTGVILGTPSYMAPEQADGSGQAVGPAADVHALGAILYELLAGTPPYKGDTQLASVRLLLAEEPVSLARLHLPRDLVTICFKCLCKEPRQRYGTALALAEDLERFLGDRPILARPAGRLERTWRWARRNPWPAAFLAAVVLLSLTVAVVSTVSGVWLRTALTQSEKHRQHAEENGADARAKLWVSLLEQARALRSSRSPGQRVIGLRAIKEALRLPVPAGHSRDELRTEAIACLMLPDVEVWKEWDGWPEGSRAFAVDDTGQRYARGDKDGNISIRRVVDDVELQHIANAGFMSDWSLNFDVTGRNLTYLGTQFAPGHPSRVWNLEGKSPKLVYEGVGWCRVAPDGRRLAKFDNNDATLRVFENIGDRECRPYAAGAPIHDVVWNPRFPKVALYSGRDCRILDLVSGKVTAVIPGSSGKMAWHPEGRILARVVGLEIQFWDTTTNRPAWPTLTAHKVGGVTLEFSRSGDHLLSSDWGGLRRLCDARQGTQQLAWPSIYYSMKLVAFPDLAGDGLLTDVASPRLRLLRLWPGDEFRSLAHQVGGRTVALSPWLALADDGRLLAVKATDGIVLVDLHRLEEVALIPQPFNSPLRISADDLWTHGINGVQRWPLHFVGSGKEDPGSPSSSNYLRVGPPVRVHPSTSTDQVGFSGDRQALAFARAAKDALLWRVGDKGALGLGPQEDVRHCEISPDGKWVATGSHDAHAGVGAKVWHAAAPLLAKWAPVELPAKLAAELPVGPYCGLRFSPDSRWLATTSGGVRLWRVGAWTEGPTVATPFDTGFAFSADSKLLAIGDGKGGIRLHVAETGKELARLTSPESTRLIPLAFTPSGDRLIAVGAESAALHILDLRALRRQLSDLGLDWDQLPLPPATPAPSEPLHVEIILPT